MSEYIKKYNPKRHADWNYGGSKWRLSRSKIDFFIECPRCFFLDNKLGIKRPSIPSFNLNIAVDTLLKKEFDEHRKTGTPHPIMEEYGIHNAKPFSHKDIDIWRDPFAGMTHIDTATGLTVSGAVDDVWVLDSGELVIVDYKATSKEGKITTLSDSSWGAQYARQIGVYQWLFTKNGFKVSPRGYFVYCNGITDADGFFDTLTFETTLVPCDGDQSWIEETLVAIKSCLDSDMYPDAAEYCEYCPYREATGKALQKIHAAHKSKQK